MTCIVYYCLSKSHDKPCCFYIHFVTVEDDDEMFKPPDMEDDEFSPFGGKGGLFSGGKGLFDDDEVRVPAPFIDYWAFNNYSERK